MSRVAAGLALPALTVLLCVAGAAVAQAPATFPSSEALRHYRLLSNPQLSADGARALLAVTDATADGGKSHVWLIDVKGGPPRQLTYSAAGDKRGEHDARWSPDGEIVLFLAHRGEHTSLFSLPMSGGEASELDIKVSPAVDASAAADALPPLKGGETRKSASEPLTPDIQAFEVSPDGAWIAFLAADPQTPGEKQQADARADADWVDHDPHGSRLYLLRRATGAVTRAAVPADVRRIAWKPDSTRLLALVQAPHHAEDLGPSTATWQVDPASPEHPESVAAVPPSVQSAVWADNGAIVYQAQAHRDSPPGYSDLYVLDVATGRSRNLTDGLEGTVGHDDPLALTDGTVVQVTEQGLRVNVGLYAAGGGPVSVLPLPVAAVQSVRSNAHRTGFLLLGSSSGQPQALYHAATLGGGLTALKTPAVVPEGTRSVPGKIIHWQSGGLAIDGLLYLPEAAATHAVPLIVEVHGGPLGAYHDEHAAFVDFLVGQGWAVLRCNPRGSSGRGAAFAAANKNDLGGGDYRDIMAGVDHVLATEHIDPARLALMGYSYGGEMAGFVEGRTTRFKAIISGAPVIDQHSEYGTEDESWYDRWYYGKPWEHPADAWRQSPLARVSAARTPFLLLQGQTDTTDPLGQSQEMYRALRQMGVPVDLVTYPRENHGGLAVGLYGRPSVEAWHGLDARNRVIAFIKKAFGESP